MNVLPFFSVVIPSYNCADLLKRALESVFSQTYTDYEIIVIDNSSTDNTQGVLKSFDNNKLNIIEVSNSGIIAYSRNKGIENAKGEWIAFLDSDDVWQSNKLEKVYNTIINNPEIILVCHNEWHMINNERKNPLTYGPAGQDLYKRLLFKGNCLSTSAVCLKKDIALESNGFSERKDFITVEDYEYWIRLAQKGDFFFINEKLGEWHTHGENYSDNALVHANALIAVKEHHFDNFINKNPDLLKAVNKGRAKSLSSAANTLRKGKYYDQAIKYSKNGILNAPMYWKNWVIILLSIIEKYFKV